MLGKVDFRNARHQCLFLATIQKYECWQKSILGYSAIKKELQYIKHVSKHHYNIPKHHEHIINTRLKHHYSSVC